jgi:SAM-dependent methyltransferase/uncharacterized protein YbaR (Trm112 family)
VKLEEQQLLPLLRCPQCHGSLQFAAAEPVSLACAEFGVLRCGCSKYPVIDGIPVIKRGTVGMFEHTTGAAEVAGVTSDQLIEMIENGRSIDALLECLVVPAPAPALLQCLLGWRLSHSTFATEVARWRGKKRVEAHLLENRDRLSAIDAFEFFYTDGSPLTRGAGDYFRMRFAQPRHLAALALLQSVRPDPKPLLDIACGAGHLAHYLTSRRKAVAVVGIDFNFFHLWIARHWIAPAAHYVCGDLQDGLPFIPDAFSATFCSDAYHYIQNREQLHREIQRCAPGRLGILTRVGNAAAMPNEGSERSVQGYLEEIGAADVRALAEQTLLQCYLDRRNPLLGDADSAATLAHSKWLSFAWNVPPQPRPEASQGVDEEWPHAVGQLGVNPIYRSEAAADGQLQLQFDFPSIWYAYENGGMLSYHPRRLQISRTQIEALREQRIDPSLQELIAKFVLVGLPRRFVSPDTHSA